MQNATGLQTHSATGGSHAGRPRHGLVSSLEYPARQRELT